jgi:hypothetical protein
MDERMDACPSFRSLNLNGMNVERRLRHICCVAAAVLMPTVCWPASLWADEPRDPLAQAVIDSLQSEPRTTPEALLEAVILASDVDAYELASSFLAEFVEVIAAMGDEREAKLAELADLDPVGLARTKRRLGERDAEAVAVITAIHQASLQRFRDPVWLAEIAKGLSNPSSVERERAFDLLSRAGVFAIPAAVDILNRPKPEDEPGRREQALAWRLIHELGKSAREPLINWLGSDDIPRWPGVLRGLAACGSRQEADLILAPLLGINSPPAVVDAATDAYQRLAGLGSQGIPSRTQAVGRLTARLDALLNPESLLPYGIQIDGDGSPDLTADEPVSLASIPVAERGGDPNLLTTASFIATEENALVRSPVSRRFVRGLQAEHLARDLLALNTTDPLAQRLIVLAQLESISLLLLPEDPETTKKVNESLTVHGGYDELLVADVIDEAAARGMHNAAATALRGVIERTRNQTPEAAAAPLSKPLREAITGLLNSPDLTLRFQAAKALVDLTEGPFVESSRVVETLAFCAESKGIDRAVIGHPQRAIRTDLESYLAQYGFQAELTSRGVDALRAANHCDTRLVLLSARLGDPDAFETAQLIRKIPADEPIGVLIAIDPVDDTGTAAFRRQFEHRLNGYEGQGLFWVTITDRLPSLFQAEISPDSGEPLAEARLGSMLSRIDREPLLLASRRSKLAADRLARGGQAVEQLAILAERGVNVEQAVPTVIRLLAQRQHATACIRMLASSDTKAAQAALAETACRPVESETLRKAAAGGLDESIDTFGILLEDATVAGFWRRYNENADPVCRAVLEVLATIDPISITSAGDTESGTAAPRRR